MGDVVADAAATLRQPVPVGSPVRGQAMVALARSASADDARRLRSALTADAALAAAFGRLSSATRAAILEELNRKAKAQAAPLDVRGTNNRGTDNRGTDNRGTDNRGTDNRGTDNRGTDNRGTDNRGTDNRGTDALSPAVPLGQSRPPGTGGPFANTQSRGDVWEEVSNLFDGALAANLRALVEEVRITPRLKRMFAWGEVQVYLALSLRKARVRRPNRAGLGLVRLGVEVGIEDFEDAVVAATKVVLLKAQGLRITEVGITTPTGEVDVGFNLQFSPAFPVALEVKWSQLLTHQQSFPGYEMGMDFEVTMVVDVLPTVEKLKELAGERIYKLQRFFEERGGRVIRWGRDAVTAAVRSRRAVVRGIGRLLLRAGRGARTVVRGALATAEVVALPLDSALFLADLLSRLGSISFKADEQNVDGWFFGGFVEGYHALAADPARLQAIERAASAPGAPMLAGVDFEAAKLDVAKVISQATIDPGRRLRSIELDWPRVLQNCKDLFHEARRQYRSFGRGAELRDALEATAQVAGRAAALQEVVAFIASQTGDEYVSVGISGVPLIRPRDGLAAWERLADAYVAFVEARNAARSTPFSLSGQTTDYKAYQDFLNDLYREAGGFPMLPGGGP